MGGQAATGAPDTTLSDLGRLRAEGFGPVLVHGGGNAINALLKKMGQEAKFNNGLRVTDLPTLAAVMMTLRGQINSELVAALNQANPDFSAIGLSGVDGRLLEARRETSRGDIGLVGEVVKVNPAVLLMALNAGFVPVIAPLAMALDEPESAIYNINGDNAAAHIAAAIATEVCVFLTDVPGVLDSQKQTIPRLNPTEAHKLIEEGVISGGMIPKIHSALTALQGAKRVLIIDGRSPNALYRAVSQSEVNGTIFEA